MPKTLSLPVLLSPAEIASLGSNLRILLFGDKTLRDSRAQIKSDHDLELVTTYDNAQVIASSSDSDPNEIADAWRDYAIALEKAEADEILTAKLLKLSKDTINNTALLILNGSENRDIPVTETMNKNSGAIVTTRDDTGDQVGIYLPELASGSVTVGGVKL